MRVGAAGGPGTDPRLRHDGVLVLAEHVLQLLRGGDVRLPSLPELVGRELCRVAGPFGAEPHRVEIARRSTSRRAARRPSGVRRLSARQTSRSVGSASPASGSDDCFEAVEKREIPTLRERRLRRVGARRRALGSSAPIGPAAPPSLPKPASSVSGDARASTSRSRAGPSARPSQPSSSRSGSGPRRSSRPRRPEKRPQRAASPREAGGDPPDRRPAWSPGSWRPGAGAPAAREREPERRRRAASPRQPGPARGAARSSAR